MSPDSVTIPDTKTYQLEWFFFKNATNHRKSLLLSSINATRKHYMCFKYVYMQHISEGNMTFFVIICDFAKNMKKIWTYELIII